MKRPAFAVSLILLATAALLYKCGTVAGIAAALVLLLFSAVCAVFKRNIQVGRFAAYVLLLSSLLCLIMTAGSYVRIMRSEALAGSRMPVTARVTDMRSVGVMGEGRTYDYTIALRAVTTADFMTADWARIPYDVLDSASRRIVNEVKGVNCIIYDITSKPPTPIEWE